MSTLNSILNACFIIALSTFASCDKVLMHVYYGEAASDNFKLESPFRQQNMQNLRYARRFIFTDSVLDMKSVTHLFVPQGYVHISHAQGNVVANGDCLGSFGE